MPNIEQPKSRIGMFLKKITDKSIDLTTLTPPVPINEVEQALVDIAENSGSGLPEVTGSGKAIVSVNGEWKEMDGYGYTDADETVHKIDSKYLPAKELPAYPAEDGSYVLTCTIASGVATLEWEAAESAG